MNKIAGNYMKRALLHREVMDRLYQSSSWIDVTHTARTVMDLTFIATMHSCGIQVPSELSASGRIPDENMQHIEGIDQFLSKERVLREKSANFTFDPASFYTREDADNAIRTADHVLSMMGPTISPELFRDASPQANNVHNLHTSRKM